MKRVPVPTEEADYSGVIEKKCGIRFKKKFIELVDSRVLFTPAKHQGNREKCEAVRKLSKSCFVDYADAMASGFSFLVVFPNNPGENMLLRASSEQQRQEWCDRLTDAITARKAKSSVSSQSSHASHTSHTSRGTSHASRSAGTSPHSNATQSQPKENQDVNVPMTPKHVKTFTVDETPTLTDILENPVLLQSYTKFLEDTFCQENILFYLDAEEYSKISNPELRRIKFLSIVNTFLVDGAEYEMDFADERRQELLEVIDNPGPSVLENLKWDIFTVMARDCVPKYVTSRQFKDFLEQQPDSPEIARSRRKLEDFFGEPLVGPLCRVELITRKRRGDKISGRQRSWLRKKYGPNFRIGHANDKEDKLKLVSQQLATPPPTRAQ